MAKILIIDDEISIRGLFKRILKNEHTVIDTGEGLKGLEMVKNENFDIIFLDMRLPFSNGIEILKKIKVIKPYQKVIIMTGDPERDKILSAKNASVDGFIAKPFNILEIKEIINKMLK